MTTPVVRFTVGGQVSPSGERGREWTVIYDGQCNVCGKLVKVLRGWDRRDLLEIVPFQDPGVAARFPWIPAEAYREALQLVGPGTQTWSGAAAIEQLLGILPAGWLLGWAFKMPVLGKLIDRFYRWFARNRYHLGCGLHCVYHPRR